MLHETLRRERPLILALILVGTILGGLLVGYEPVGGDPDRMYRPLKSELARRLDEGRLPFWSHRFGLGVPLIAESHVAAFYPPNLVLYRLLDVSTAYRLSMWLHYLALVATTYFYARCLGIAPWGGAMAAVTFTLCGFQAIHSSHEPFYCLMPYLPLALGLAERSLATGRLGWLAALPITLGLQWTLGHFQIQTWTGGLVIMTGFWRAAFDRQPWRRAFALDPHRRLGSGPRRRSARPELAILRDGETNPCAGQRPALLFLTAGALVRASPAPAGPRAPPRTRGSLLVPSADHRV